jgi:serralysin
MISGDDAVAVTSAPGVINGRHQEDVVFRRTAWSTLAVAVVAVTTSASVGAAGLARSATTTAHTADKVSDGGPPGSHAGPPYEFKTELMSYAPSLRVKDQAILARTKLGYRLWSGGQDSHLTVSVLDGKLSFRDTGTKSFKRLSPKCERQRVRVGISALCKIPSDISVRRPLLVEIWPRLGDDYTDASTLPATFAVSMLSDEGNDVAKLGAGPDFFNGHLGRDRVWGGGGNDWVRGGDGNDHVYGGLGNDDIVGMENNDTVHGGDGNDRIWTGPGSDNLVGDEGADLLICGTGIDTATQDASDQVSRNCDHIR